MFLIAGILFVILLKWNVERHYHLWKKAIGSYPSVEKRVAIDHKKETRIRMYAFSPVVAILFLKAIVIHQTFNHELTHPMYVKNLLGMGYFFASAAIVCSLFWPLFNGFFNNIRKFNWFYKGTVDKDEAKTDNFLRNKSVTFIVIVQSLLIIISFLSYFYIVRL